MTEEKMISKVQKLIAKAEATEFEAERIAFLAKAHELMQLNMLTEYDLKVKGQAQNLTVKRRDRVPVCSASSKFLQDSFVDLAAAVARFCRCRLILHGANDTMSDCTATVFGMENDLEYFEMLYTSLRLQAWQKIDPAWDDKLTLAQNVFAMKAAGLKWATIAVKCHAIPYEEAFDKKDSSWISIYKKECAAQGAAPIGAQPKNYQLNFMKAFVINIEDRLEQIRRDSAAVTTSGTMALAIRDNDEQVSEAVAKAYPKLGRAKRMSSGKINQQARHSGAEAGRNANLGVGNRDGVGSLKRELSR